MRQRLTARFGSEVEPWLDDLPRVLRALSKRDTARIANEATALATWTTIHTPTVLAVDNDLGALLIETIEPGTPLVESLNYPDPSSVAELVASIHSPNQLRTFLALAAFTPSA